MPLAPEKAVVIIQTRLCSIKKAWESNRYSSHKQRLWHCPVWLNEQRRNPRRYVLKHISTEFLSAMLRTQKLRKMNAYIHIPQASTVALSVTIP